MTSSILNLYLRLVPQSAVRSHIYFNFKFIRLWSVWQRRRTEWALGSGRGVDIYSDWSIDGVQPQG